MDLEVLSPRRRRQLAALLVVAFAVVALLDIMLPVGYAVAVIYVVLVFIVALEGRVRWVVGASGVALAATAVAGVLKPHLTGPMPSSAIAFNRVSISITVAAAGLIASLIVVRSKRLTAVSGRLSSTSVELEKQSQLLRAASQVGKVAGWSLARDEGSPVVWSDEVEPLFGIRPGQRTLRDDVLGFVDDEEDRARLLEGGLNCLRDGTPFMTTFRATGGDGRHMWLTVMGEATRNDVGRIVGLAGALQDVTQWKEAEETAAAQGRRFAQFANSLPSVIWTAEPNGAIDYFNDVLVAYTGKSGGDLIADQWLSALHPDDVEDTIGEWQRALATGEPYSTAFRLRRADGEYRWFRVAAQAERADDGSIVKWWGNAGDVHEHRLLEDQARALAKERADILESIGDGVYALDSDFRFNYLNANAERMLRAPATELLGSVFWEAFPERRGTEVEESFKVARATGAAQRFTTHNPVLEAWFDVTVSPTPHGFTVFFRDITELRTVTEQLAQAQRMESVGRLTGGIAHDFNNLLTVVVGGAEALGEEPNLSEEGRGMVELVMSAAGRGAELTHQLLAFARRQPLAPQVVDIAALVREFTPILSRAIGPGITEATVLAEGLPGALVDPAQLENAILNLAINAGDSMPYGGTLTIRAEFVELDEAYATTHSEVLPGSYILISVSDTGTGISSENLPHIFDPFFTTKATGEGSGLGLAMVWGFAKQTGGHVTVYSEEGIGSTFRLYLPVAPSTAAATRAAPSKPRQRREGVGHILLAEDDPLVRQFAAERLLDHGFEVTAAATGVEALELLKGIKDLTLLFTDVIMKGGVSGRELADAVVSSRPGTPVLFASGYTEDVMVHHGRLDPDVLLLAKPYTGRQLIERIHSVLGDEEEGDEG